jgi:hypothetical protein
MSYLDGFRKKLEKGWKGSLVSVAEATAVEPNAKKYLSQLARKGQIEKVIWGWYWIPDNHKDFFDFLAKDKHFKVLQKQTAASVWNGDFVHRDSYAVAVSASSYGRALRKFADSRGWDVVIEIRDFRANEYVKRGGLFVEALEETIVDCVKGWAFADAFSSLHENHDTIDWDRIYQHSWDRISGSDSRVGQILKYGTSVMSRTAGADLRAMTRAYISDDFVRRQVEEAAERVVDLA